MGTSASIQIEDEEGEPLVGIRVHWDGNRIPTFVKKFSDGKPVVNGYNGEDMFNGMGDYAARLIANLKFKRYDGFEDYTKPGDIYVVPYAEAYGEYEVLVKYGGPNNPVIVQRQVDGEPFGKININNKKTNMKGAETFDAESKKMCIVCNEKPVDYSHPNTLGALCSTPKCLHYVFDAETFGADYSLYDRKTKQKVGVKSGYHDYKDAYDDWEEEIVNKYPNRVSENEWIVIDTHSAETFAGEYEELITTCPYCEGKKIDDHGKYELVGCFKRYLEDSTPHPDAKENQIVRDRYYRGLLGNAETFNSYKVAPALSSYTKEELISSKAGPQGSASYDEMEYDPIAQDRLSAESFNAELEDEPRAIVLYDIVWKTNKDLPEGVYISAYDEEHRDEDIQDYLYERFNDYAHSYKLQLEGGNYTPDAFTDMNRFPEKYGAESFASETSSTLKSMGYVAGTIGVGYLLFQRFVKDRLDEMMNQ